MRGRRRSTSTTTSTERSFWKATSPTSHSWGYSEGYFGVEPQLLYNDLCKQLLRRVILSYDLEGAIDVVIDRFLYEDARAKFDRYLLTALERDIHIFHLDSKQCPCLQAADFVVGAIARKYRDNDDLFYSRIQHKITVAFEFTE